MGEIRTSVAIKAAPSDVWDVLMDFDSYHEWNPFIRSIEGSPVKGASIEVLLGASGKRPMKFSPLSRRAIHLPASRGSGPSVSRVCSTGITSSSSRKSLKARYSISTRTSPGSWLP